VGGFDESVLFLGKVHPVTWCQEGSRAVFPRLTFSSRHFVAALRHPNLGVAGLPDSAMALPQPTKQHEAHRGSVLHHRSQTPFHRKGISQRTHIPAHRRAARRVPENRTPDKYRCCYWAWK
jgi:hypothetical protein